MNRIFTREWEIAKAYIDEVAVQEGMLNLEWDDFRMMAGSHCPSVAVRAEGDMRLKDLLENAMADVMKHHTGSLTGFIVSVSYSEDEDFMMDEMLELCECMNQKFSVVDVDIKWGIRKNASLESKRCVSVFAFAW